VDLLGNHPELGLAPRGFRDSRLVEQRLPLPVLGESAGLADMVTRGGSGLRSGPGDVTDIGSCRPRTRTHVRSILTKLQVRSRLEAVSVARAAGLRPIDDDA
jgi:hypothetical protein